MKGCEHMRDYHILGMIFMCDYHILGNSQHGLFLHNPQSHRRFREKNMKIEGRLPIVQTREEK